MKSRNLFVSGLMACLLATGFGGVPQTAEAAPGGHALRNPGIGAGSNVVEVKQRRHHRHGVRYYLPIVPYTAYDYPYYYSRGFYPTHIGRGYVYYGRPYQYYVSEYNEGEGDDEYGNAPYSAKERCARRFKSFEWDTGLYTTYRGPKKVCPYLR